MPPPPFPPGYNGFDMYYLFFFRFNVQFIHILQYPADSYAKMMKKIAGDIVHRILDGLSKIEIVDKPLDKKTLFQCFLAGESVARYGKRAVKKGRSDLGRELIVNHDGDEKSYLTSNLFEKPTTVWTKGIGQHYSKQLTASTEKYLLRHTFHFEEDECQHAIRLDDPHLKISQR